MSPISPAVQDARSGLEALDLFDESCRKFPARTAVEWRGKRFSYAQLDAAARALAGRLDQREVPRGAPVGVFLEDRVAVIAAMLAIFRSGRVFVPLDPDGPALRAREILNDAHPAVLVLGAGAEGSAAVLEGSPHTEALVFEMAGQDEPYEPREPASRERPDPDVPAYVYYTSGTTGRPKGIVGRLLGLSHFVRWEIEEFQIAEGARFSQVTVPTFDVYFRDVLVPLAVGGTVCIPPHPLWSLDGEAILRWLEEARVEMVHCVPSLLSVLLAEPLDPDRLPLLRRVFLAGEVLHIEDVRRWRQVFGERIELVNLYGPTETTMAKFFHRVERRDLDRGFVPIGKAIPGARGLVLGDDGSLCPPGVVGELYIRTPYRTLGYHGRPDLTGEAFVRNPFRDDPKDLLYRTGDRMRLLPDGNLQFLGRRDHQVKIRGLRVELSEVESHLRSHPSVREAAAAVRTEEGHEPRLVAFVVAREGSGFSRADLRHFLKNRVPSPMVPAEWVNLGVLPRTPTGKVDREALGRIRVESASETAFLPPRTPLEETLAAIWEEVLNVDRIGVDDDFFDRGHSLLAMQAVSRIRKELGKDLEVATLFEHPTVATLARAILDSRTSSGPDASARFETPSGESSIPARARGGSIPLSFGQEGLWFLDQLEAGAANNVHRVLRLTGRLDEEALQHALDRIVERHESTRTNFLAVEGRPEQRISSGVGVPLTVLDFRRLPESSRAVETRRFVEAELGRPFDLSRDRMLRANLLRLGEEEQVLTLVMHHIASDGWSMGVLTRELSAAYAPFGQTPGALPELPIQYSDYAVWQREWLADERLGQQLAFWKKTLAGPSVSLDLPFDRRRPARPSTRGASLDFALPDPLPAGLKSLGRSAGTTLFMTLLSGFYALLHRYTGATDLRVGSFITNRGRTELEALIGFFINTLVLRTDLSGDPSFRELLGRVRETTLQAYRHPDVPFERLVEELHPERSLTQMPLFQVGFVLQNMPRPPIALSGLRAEILGTERQRSRHDLTILLWEKPGGLIGTISYNPDLFDPSTVSRLSGHYRALLEEVVSDPDRRLSRLSLLSTQESDQLLLTWNATDAEFPRERSFAELFEEQAVGNAERKAARCGNEEVTYRELDRRASRGARELADRGIGPETVVGMLADRGLDFLAAILAVFKAGGGYLPLDPASPPERLSRMIQQTATPVILLGRKFAPLLEAALAGIPPDERPVAVPIESMGFSDADPSTFSPRSGPRLAYVIYTSGSTGLPKGAMVEQVGMLNHLFAKVTDLGLTAEDVVAQTASQSFDISVWQNLAPLLVGGRVEILPDGIAHDPTRLLQEVERTGVTVLETVPSLLRAALEERDAAQDAPALFRLRWLIATGEALPPSLCAQWLKAYPRTPVLNAYGPTECSDDVTHFVLADPPPPEATYVPIGRPVANMRMYVTDSGGRPVPLGVAGELWVGGAGVGRGYLGDPVRTAEAFVPDPFGKEPGGRLYRTGDLVRYGPGGNLVYLGRIDHQVKVRGFRIELGEVESALAAHPEVREAVVVAREAATGDLRLVAYIVPAGESPHPSELRAYLGGKVPAFMVPSAVVVLSKLPLTPNGKLDRKALPDPEPDRLDSTALPQEPRNDLEHELCSIWTTLLGLERVGIHDNFFELGGHSLLATQLLSRVRRAFDVDLPIRVIFERPTVAGLAEALEGSGKSSGVESAPAMLAAGEPVSGEPRHE